MHRLRPILPAAALIALLAAPTALAAEPTGRGANITPVANLSYTGSGESLGTDIEFHTYTVDGVEKTYSFAGSYGTGMQIVDITDPENPGIAAVYDCGVSQGDVQIFTRPDLGDRVFATYTHDDGYSFKGSDCADEAAELGFDVPRSPDGTFIADVTDPTHPFTVAFVPFAQGSHNMTVHPSGRFLYNSNSDLITEFLPAVEIVDITDISAPESAGELALKTFPGLGTESHDITFNSDGSRAYVAALSHAEIIDTTDPAAPESIGTIIDPAINVWHQSDPVTIDDPLLGERDFLIVEDEVAGALPTGQCPNGGVHVYDMTDELEAAPVKVGYWNISDVGLTEDGLGGCTAHVFDVHEQEQLMTIAYYNGGVRVVDLSGLVGAAIGNAGVGMKQLGWYRFPDSNTWAVKAPSVDRAGFYLYGNDHRRGFDVYRYAPTPGSAVAGGSWVSADQGLPMLTAARAGKELPTPYCLLRR